MSIKIIAHEVERRAVLQGRMGEKFTLWEDKPADQPHCDLGFQGDAILTKEAVAELIPLLTFFATHGILPEKWPNPNPYPPKDRSKTRTELKILSHRWETDAFLGDELYYLVEIPEAKLQLWTMANNLPDWVRKTALSRRSFSVEANLKGTNWAELAPEAWGWGY